MSAPPPEPDETSPLDYLRVDSFIETAVGARALKTAFELRLVDHLVAHPSADFEQVRGAIGVDRQGLRLLLGLLRANGVVEESDERVSLSEAFLRALPYRDLLEAKIDFANLVAPDFAGLFTSLVQDPGRFMREARLFRLFDYQRCFKYTPENYEATRRWMRFTTALTRYEGRVCARRHDFSRVRRMLDVGGNSGEFALQVCRQHPQLVASVFDLPLVCHIGREHLSAQPEASRISFTRGNILTDELPRGFDLISFKSMLHDWPEPQACQFLARAAAAVEPGGTLLVFERGPIELGKESPPYGLIPMLLFFRSFRGPDFYLKQMQALGFVDVRAEPIQLEMPFFLATGRKPG